MDRLLARVGRPIWPYLACAVCAGLSEDETGAVWLALTAASVVFFALSVRAAALSNGRTARHWAPWLLTTLRVALAAAAAAVAWEATDLDWARPVMAAVAAASAVAVIRPFPEWLDVRC